MSECLTGIEFESLLNQSLQEYKEKRSLFGVPVYVPKEERTIGPAAGPHTQLAQNIIAAYAAGARYFELKTVQVLEGEALGIVKPCIYVRDEGYNTEWSTELTVKEARDEYIKAWLILQLIMREFNLGESEHCIFNMSVGYDLEGIKSSKVDAFIEDMKDASKTTVWIRAMKYVLSHMELFEKLTPQEVRKISPYICKDITLSTMHGCPAEDIEKIAEYLLVEKQLNVAIKCNPTLVGKEETRKILNQLGYIQIEPQDGAFEKDISFNKMVSLIKKLEQVSKKVDKNFSVKLTNTFPVKIKNQELAGDTMYLSGKALYPLAIRVATMLSEAFKGKLAISYSGGIDAHNILQVYKAGITSITISTLILKSGGYKNLTVLQKKLEDVSKVDISVEKLKVLEKEVLTDPYYTKQVDRQVKKTKVYSLTCAKCKNCQDVCPNRANLRLEAENRYVIHIDKLCNECGNCKGFCPLGHSPYEEKLTFFSEVGDYRNSKQSGFYIKDLGQKEIGIRFVNDKDCLEEKVLKLKDISIDALKKLQNLCFVPETEIILNRIASFIKGMES